MGVSFSPLLPQNHNIQTLIVSVANIPFFFHLKSMYVYMIWRERFFFIPKTAISNKMLLNRTLHAYFDQSPKSNHFNVKAKLYTECFTFKLGKKAFRPFLSMHLFTIFLKICLIEIDFVFPTCM